MSKYREKKLTSSQNETVEKHLKKIREELKEIQTYLDHLGLSPVGGWNKPNEYNLVSGIKISKKCSDCSIVCWDNSCDCVEKPFKQNAIVRSRTEGEIYIKDFEGSEISLKGVRRK